jgi:hypothetical protein
LRTKKPEALAEPPASKSRKENYSNNHLNHLDSEATSPSPERNAKIPTAAEPCPDRGESDFAYFEARPWARSRIRAPFADEFPPEFLKHRDGGTAVVIVTVARRADGAIRRARGLVFPNGGTA